MQVQNEKKHVIDFLFPIALLFVFAASSFVVILLAANIYSNTTASSQEHYDTRTPLSYVTEKVRQADENGMVQIGTFHGLDSLILTQEFNDKQYVTYIYDNDGKLMELFIQKGVDADISAGTEIMAVSDFTMEETSDGMLKFSCTADGGKTMTALVSVTSRNKISSIKTSGNPTSNNNSLNSNLSSSETGGASYES